MLRESSHIGDGYVRIAAQPQEDRVGPRSCHLGLDRLGRRLAKSEAAREHFGAAATMYRQMGMRFWLEQPETAMGEPR
jgi:hypothetical protein